MNPRKKVMVVDDSDIVREVLAATLEARGYTVVTLEHVFEFSRTLRRENPDIVLLDVSMPALQGDALLEVAKRYGLDKCPIVLHSSRAEDELLEITQACGAAGYIRKTDDTDTLVAEIERFIGKGKKK